MLSFGVTFVITIANFAVLFFILRALLWKRLRGFMDARTERVRRETGEAQAVRRAAEEMRQRYEDLLSNATDEAEWVLKDAEENAEERSREILADAASEAAEMAKRAAERNALEVAQARDELAAQIARLATAAAGAVCGRALDGEAELRAAEEFLTALGKSERPGAS